MFYLVEIKPKTTHMYKLNPIELVNIITLHAEITIIVIRVPININFILTDIFAYVAIVYHLIW